MAFLFSGQTSKCLPRRFPVLFCPCLLVSCQRFPIKSGFPSQMICEEVDAAWSMREWLGRWTCNSKVPSWVSVLSAMFMIVPSSNPRPRLWTANWFASYQLFSFLCFFLTMWCDSTTVWWGTSSSVGYTEADSETQSTNSFFQVVVLYFLLVLALRF